MGGVYFIGGRRRGRCLFEGSVYAKAVFNRVNTVNYSTVFIIRRDIYYFQVAGEGRNLLEGSVCS